MPGITIGEEIYTEEKQQLYRKQSLFIIKKA